MKVLPLIFAGLMAAVIACNGGTKIEVGQLVSGTITDKDADVTVKGRDWKSQKFVIDVDEGVEYLIDLSSRNGTLVGIWRTDKDDSDQDSYVVISDPEESPRTVPFTFAMSGAQELFLKTPDAHVPSPFTFRVWLR